MSTKGYTLMRAKGRDRRHLLRGAVAAAGAAVLSGCDRLSQNESFVETLKSAQHLSRAAQKIVAPRAAMAQEFSPADVAQTFRSNGTLNPGDADYVALRDAGFAGYKLSVGGLVARPAEFTLDELKAMPARTQITRHDCVEGWSVIGKWKGVRLEEIINRVQPATDARYVVFRCMDTDSDGVNYFESIDMIDAVHPQTILAYELNDRPLPIDNGAPLRLRVENQLGYKHAKYIRALEFVSSLDKIGQGKGGYWEDQGYEWYAGI